MTSLLFVRLETDLESRETEWQARPTQPALPNDWRV
jgi:hypothetical protein